MSEFKLKINQLGTPNGKFELQRSSDYTPGKMSKSSLGSRFIVSYTNERYSTDDTEIKYKKFQVNLINLEIKSTQFDIKTKYSNIYGAYIPTDMDCPYLVIRYGILHRGITQINLALMERKLMAGETLSWRESSDEQSSESEITEYNIERRVVNKHEFTTHDTFREINGYEELTHQLSDDFRIRNMNGMMFFIADMHRREYIVLKADFGAKKFII